MIVTRVRLVRADEGVHVGVVGGGVAADPGRLAVAGGAQRARPGCRRGCRRWPRATRARQAGASWAASDPQSRELLRSREAPAHLPDDASAEFPVHTAYASRHGSDHSTGIASCGKGFLVSDAAGSEEQRVERVLEQGLEQIRPRRPRRGGLERLERRAPARHRGVDRGDGGTRARRRPRPPSSGRRARRTRRGSRVRQRRWRPRPPRRSPRRRGAA